MHIPVLLNAVLENLLPPAAPVERAIDGTLGAGGHSVRFNGVVFEAISARLQHRASSDLYHSALEVRLGQARYTIEMAPVWNERAKERGVVCEGVVGSRLLGGLRLFRYEIRCWRDGRIPDIADAVDSPQPLSEDPAVARRVGDALGGVSRARVKLHPGRQFTQALPREPFAS